MTIGLIIIGLLSTIMVVAFITDLKHVGWWYGTVNQADVDITYGSMSFGDIDSGDTFDWSCDPQINVGYASGLNINNFAFNVEADTIQEGIDYLEELFSYMVINVSINGNNQILELVDSSGNFNTSWSGQIFSWHGTNRAFFNNTLWNSVFVASGIHDIYIGLSGSVGYPTNDLSLYLDFHMTFER